MGWPARQFKPLFDSEAQVNREYEVRLYDFCGRPGY